MKNYTTVEIVVLPLGEDDVMTTSVQGGLVNLDQGFGDIVNY